MKNLLLTVGFAALLTANASAQLKPADTVTRTNPTPAALSSQMDSLFNFLEQHKMFNGNVAIGMDGKTIYQRSVGFANLKTGEKLTEGSVFEMASVSKQFTAAGILLLVERKKLRYDQKLETIFPDFPYEGITIQNLLNHTSGLPNYMALFGEHWDTTKIASNKDLIPMLKKYKPAVEFKPNEKWQYSNTGYALMVCIIEKITKQPFADYMKKELFNPLGMQHTMVYSRRWKPQSVPHYAFGYVLNDNGDALLPDEDPDNASKVYALDGFQGDGCVNTTTGDMMKWLNTVYERKFFTRATWDLAMKPCTTKDGKTYPYGFGWMLDYGPKSGNILSHTGGWPGYNTYDALFLDRNVSIVFLNNVEQPGSIFAETMGALKKIVIGAPFDMPKPFVRKKAVAIDKSVYKTYTGTYGLFDGMDIMMTDEEGHLFMTLTDQEKIELQPESAVKFFINEVQVSVEFVPNAGKPVDSFIFQQHGQTFTGKRKS